MPAFSLVARSETLGRMSLRHHVRVWTNEPLGANVRFGAKKREPPPDQFYFRLCLGLSDACQAPAMVHPRRQASDKPQGRKPRGCWAADSAVYG